MSAIRYTVQAISGTIQPNENETNSRGEPKAPDVAVELRVVEGPEAGKTIWVYGSLHENSQQYTVEMLRTLGWSCNDITTLTGLGSVKAIAVEKAGKPYTDKSGVSKMGKPGWSIWPVKTPKPTLEADKAASFAARYKALAASIAPVEVTSTNMGIAADQMPAATITGNNKPVVDGAAGGPLSF